jgi:hypothetical protein
MPSPKWLGQGKLVYLGTYYFWVVPAEERVQVYCGCRVPYTNNTTCIAVCVEDKFSFSQCLLCHEGATPKNDEEIKKMMRRVRGLAAIL